MFMYSNICYLNLLSYQCSFTFKRQWKGDFILWATDFFIFFFLLAMWMQRQNRDARITLSYLLRQIWWKKICTLLKFFKRERKPLLSNDKESFEKFLDPDLWSKPLSTDQSIRQINVGVLSRFPTSAKRPTFTWGITWGRTSYATPPENPNLRFQFYWFCQRCFRRAAAAIVNKNGDYID